jgi:hypothetical protein
MVPVQCGNGRLFLFPPFLSILLDQSVFMNEPTILHRDKPLNDLSSLEKGFLFEDYIVTLFDNKSGRFRLLTWRSDKKASNGVLAESNSYPDLEFCFIDRKKRFAIECKWRHRFYDGKLAWAKKNQIEIYREYEIENKIPVFIAIGVGGHPSDPAQLFVTPLSHIQRYPEVFKSHLVPYTSDPAQRFFYDAKQLTLFQEQ